MSSTIIPSESSQTPAALGIVSLDSVKRLMDADRFSRWLKERRDARNWTQKVLADKIDVTKGRVSQWESGEIPPLDKLVALAEALKADIREPLNALGVLKDEAVEVTPDEREALTHLRGMPQDVSAIALELLNALAQLSAGRATRKSNKKRTASGYQKQSKAS